MTFSEMVEQIIVDYHEKIDTVAYQYFQVLRSIRDAYAEYPNEPWNHCTESNCKDCNSSDVCNLFKQISILNEKTEIDKNQIIHNLILKTPVVGKNNNLPQDSMVSHLFLNLLDEIKTLGLERNNAYQTVKSSLKGFISDSGRVANVEKVVKYLATAEYAPETEGNNLVIDIQRVLWGQRMMVLQ